MDETIVTKYSDDFSTIWDDFVNTTNGGTLHSKRSFLNYHKDKFQDFSLMFKIKNKVVAILPAVIVDKKLISHPGASYGGLIYKENLKMESLLDINHVLNNICEQNNIESIEMRFPYSIISKNHFDKLKYCLAKQTNKVSREISQYIDLKSHQRGSYSENFNRILKKDHKLTTQPTTNKEEVSKFYTLLEQNLLKHNTKPTHTFKELIYLIDNLKDECKVFLTTDEEGHIVSGSFVLELTKNTAHTFYLCSDYRFIKKSPLVNTIDHMAKYYKNLGFDHLNLGISTENKGENINLSLNNFKEKFNSCGTVRETFHININ